MDWNEPDGTINHGVSMVGYGDNYWELKNTWGSSWGEGGYFKLKKSDNSYD